MSLFIKLHTYNQDILNFTHIYLNLWATARSILSFSRSCTFITAGHVFKKYTRYCTLPVIFFFTQYQFLGCFPWDTDFTDVFPSILPSEKFVNFMNSNFSSCFHSIFHFLLFLFLFYSFDRFWSGELSTHVLTLKAFIPWRVNAAARECVFSVSY